MDQCSLVPGSAQRDIVEVDGGIRGLRLEAEEGQQRLITDKEVRLSLQEAGSSE
jgi:hypothetical protein